MTSAPGSIHSVAQQRLRRGEARRLHDDVGTADARLPVVGDDHRLAEVVLELLGKGTSALGAPRMHADLGAVEKVIDQPDVPVRRAARPDVAQHLRVLPRKMPGAQRRHGTGAHVRQHGGIEYRARRPRLRIEERQHGELGRQPLPPVVDEISDDLDAGDAERRDDAAQHVEMALGRALGHEVHARLEHGLPQPLRAQPAFDRGQDLVVGKREGGDIGAVEVREVDRGHGRQWRGSSE